MIPSVAFLNFYARLRLMWCHRSGFFVGNGNHCYHRGNDVTVGHKISKCSAYFLRNGVSWASAQGHGSLPSHTNANEFSENDAVRKASRLSVFTFVQNYRNFYDSGFIHIVLYLKKLFFFHYLVHWSPFKVQTRL